MKVSVITVCYNDCVNLRKTIESVRAQDYPHIEYVIVDGGSTDGTLDMIHENSSHIDVWVSEPDTGVYDAMNKAARIASGNYLIFMNAGDLFYADDIVTRFTTQAICYPKATWFYGDTDVDGSIIRPPTRWLKAMLYFRTICHQSLFVKRELLLDEWKLDLSFPICADQEWILRLIASHQDGRYLGFPVSRYLGNGISSNPTRIQADRKRLVRLRYTPMERIAFATLGMAYHLLRKP